MTINVDAVLAAAAQLTVLIAAAGAGLLWFKRWVKAQVAEPLGQVHDQVTPNHGASMKDAVDRTERAMSELTKRFDDHLLLGHRGEAHGG